jgi:hypothetical protein
MLLSCIYGAPSLTKGRICNSQCNHSTVRIAQNPKPYFTVSSETPPTWRARFPYLYPPGTGRTSYTPGHWAQSQSHVTTDGQSISYVLVPSPLGIKEAPSEKFQFNIRRCTLRRNFWCYHLEGCMRSMQCNVEFGYQLSICSGTTGNLDRVGRSQDLPDANWLLASSPALHTQALTLVPICPFFFSFLWKHLQVVFTKILSAYNLDKHQTVYNICGRDECMYVCSNMFTIIHISVTVIPWLSVNLEAHCILYKKNRLLYKAYCSSNNKDHVSQLILLFFLQSDKYWSLDLSLSQQIHYSCSISPHQTLEHFFLSHHIHSITQLFFTLNLTPIPPTTYSRSRSYFTTDSMSWYLVPLWDLRP